MTQRIILVHNPRSSKHLKIQNEVIEPAQKMSGYMIGKFEVKSAPVDENVENLTKILADGDLVILAGGDGTATVGLNAAMRSGKDVTLGVLGYGNFNDFARTLGNKNIHQIVKSYESGETQRLFPLEAILDGKIWRYAACYFTIGMFAESTEIFDAPSTRKSLRKGKKSLVFSILQLAKWYFGNRKKDFLAGDIQLNDIPMNHMRVEKNGRKNRFKGKHVSDVMFINGKTAARVMKGGDYWQSPENFFVSFGRLKSFFRLCGYMVRSMVYRMPGHVENQKIKVDFSGPEEFEIQAEGEYMKVKAQELIVRKNETGVKVVVPMV